MGALPGSASEFEWDDRNIDKFARRDIRPADVEAVLANGASFRPNKRTGTATWLMTGHDDGGRRLTVGVLWADEQQRVLRAITAWAV